MSDALKEKLAAFSGAKPSAQLHSSILFPELAKEINNDPSSTANLNGLFIVTVLKKGTAVDEWYLLFQGRGTPAVISQTRPNLPSPPVKGKTASADAKSQIPVVVVEIEDHDILNFVTGGLSAVKAFVSGRIKIVGDMQTAFQLEEVFVKAGGVEKTLRFIKDHNLPVGKGGKKAKL
ncbi:hypothetical protein HDU67_010106 [Dinochytrium kinnereticum]|nr:hypothetical protein HDU67_010106 [Dinochytrium kinnereticum]